MFGYVEGNIWKPTEVIEWHEAPRSIMLKDQKNKIKKRNEIDIKISKSSDNGNHVNGHNSLKY